MYKIDMGKKNAVEKLHTKKTKRCFLLLRCSAGSKSVHVNLVDISKAFVEIHKCIIELPHCYCGISYPFQQQRVVRKPAQAIAIGQLGFIKCALPKQYLS